MSKRYTIDKLTDLLDLDPRQFNDCLEDMKTWHALMQPLVTLAKVAGQDPKTVTRRFTWIDDGKHDATIRTDIEVKE